MLGKIEGRKKRGPEVEMVGWHHPLKGHEFEQTPGDNEGHYLKAMGRENPGLGVFRSLELWFTSCMASVT